MQAHYFQHVPFEGLGAIEQWLDKAGYNISCTRFYESGVLPQVEDIDLLIVMGGPMSVNDESVYPWLVQEKAFIRDAVAAKKCVLGICLGAQLIADAMGGRVFPNPVKEIGWFPVTAVKPGHKSFFQFPGKREVFHWHGETFSLPEGGVRLAESDGCANQAFQLGRNVMGLQFHLETTPASVGAIVENCADELNCAGELVDGQFIQTADEILSVPQTHYDEINGLMGEVLDYLNRVHP